MGRNHKRNITGLTVSREKKSQECKDRVNAAFVRLLQAKSRINFNSVATEASVTKAYLYTNKEFRDRIETLRKEQEGLPSAGQVKREITDASKDVLITAIREKIKILERENEQLRQEAQRLRGKLYEQF